MKSGEQVEALQLAYEAEKPLSFIETISGNQLSEVTVDEVQSEDVSDDSVERLVGEDGAGIRVAFDIVYDEGEIREVLVRRGRANAEYGELSEVVLG